MKLNVGMRRKTKLLCSGIKRVRFNRLVYALFVLTASLYALYAISDESSGLKSSAVQLLSDDSWKRDNNATRVILYWTSFFNHRDFYFGYGRQPFLACPVSNCLTTNDRSRTLDAHAVVFHSRDLSSYDLPQIRRSDQRYVFLLYESPQHTWLNLRTLTDFFNWTMTYRFDSDIPPRLRLVKLDSTTSNGQPGNGTVTRRKKKLIAWIVSNCWTYNRRETYVAELRRHLPVDVYGACGVQNDVCSKEVSLEQCYAGIERDYKFYLSFENSNCRDYFTEKWTNVLRYDLVPVVYGGADYGAFAPPHSYVNVMDFTSPRNLAEHLRRLGANDTLYNEYLRWKQDYRMEVNTMPWCDLCAKLHNASEPRKSYTNIHAWWMDGGNCSDALRLPEMGRSSLSKYAAYALDGVTFKLQTLALNIKFMWQAMRA